MFDRIQLLQRLRKIWFGFAVVTPKMVVDTIKVFYNFITGRAACLALLAFTLAMLSFTSFEANTTYRLDKPHQSYSRSYRLSQPSAISKRKVSEKGSRFSDAKADKLVVASATWCQPCKRLYPVIERLADAGYDAKVVYDYDGPGDVTAYPTLLFFLDGKLVDRLVGVQTEAEIKRRLTK